jgi:hypothetical protein
MDVRQRCACLWSVVSAAAGMPASWTQARAGAAAGEHLPSRLAERGLRIQVGVAALVVAFRGPMGWLPDRLPAACGLA